MTLADVSSWKKQHRDEYLRRHRERERNRSQWRRAWVITILGGRCELCGCANPLMLTLDHCNGDGAQHRKEVGRDPNRMYTAVLRDGCDPARYRCLCGSCNLAVSNYGEEAVVASIKEERRSIHE